MVTYKLSDYPTLLEFLDEETIATVAAPIDSTGTIHAASLRYWHSPASLQFYFVTDQNSEKCSLLKAGKTLQGACVVGTYHGTPFTLQMRGTLQIVDTAGYASEIDAYYLKRGNRNEDVNNRPNVLLQFTPTWARFTDYSKGYGHFLLKLS